jgi:4-diphosphocytidyl-2-C-methyl-D-erythritol kinase
MHAPFTLPSFAKVNLYLRVIGKRDDGFHEICTVFQTISLHDRIAFSAGDTIRLYCRDPRIPIDCRNLIVRAAEMLRERYSVKQGAKIRLEKKIPSPGGLGGGSSNAAVALIGLKRLWDLDISDDDLLQIAAELGSDVPFFLHGGTAIGTGRGEMIEPIADKMAGPMLVVTPKKRVSTPKAYAAIGASNLTNEASNRILRVCRNEAESLDPLHSVLINDFESSVFAAFPEIGEVKRTLLDLGASNAVLSGSGASVVGIFDKEETRQAAIKALDIRSTWRKFAVAAISRDEYRGALRR